jgi:hypothetical protein
MRELAFETGDSRKQTPSEEREDTDPVADFIIRNERAFRQYAGDDSLHVRSAEGVMTPEGPLETCAIDLKKGEYYLHRRFLEQASGGSEEKGLFGTFHEIEHFRELRDLLRKKGGAEVWRGLQAKKKVKRRYHILDNSFGDVKVNRAVVNRAPVFTETRKSLYRDDLFPGRDMTDLPKHLQFAHLLNCELQDTGETWTVAPDVREAFDRLRAVKGRSGIRALDYATHPDTSMLDRLLIQDRLIEPIYESFFEEDAEEKRKKGRQEESSGSETGGEPDSGDGESVESEGGGEQRPGEPDANPSTSSGTEASGSDGGEDTSNGTPSEGADTVGNPEDMFRKEYDEYFERHPEAVPADIVEREAEEEIARQAAARGGRDAGRDALDTYAEAQGVSPEELRAYQRFRKSLEGIIDPETREPVMDGLRELFERIIARRVKSKPEPRYPLPEGDELEFPAEAVVRTRAGEAEPDVWSDIEIREREGEMVGDFDIAVVGDVSGTMAGTRATEQRKAIGLVLEALSEFSERLDEIRTRLQHDLWVRNEAWVFGDEDEEIKKLSEGITEQERVKAYKRLGKADGGHTRDYLVLEKLANRLTEEEIERMRRGTLKKIVIVMTDGKSHGAEKVRGYLKTLREAGVIVVGIGITEDGRPALTTYAPDAELCEDASRLASVLARLLREHLRDV